VSLSGSALYGTSVPTTSVDILSRLCLSVCRSRPQSEIISGNVLSLSSTNFHVRTFEIQELRRNSKETAWYGSEWFVSVSQLQCVWLSSLKIVLVC